MCEWGAILDDLAATCAEGGGRALCAGAELVVEVLAFMTGKNNSYKHKHVQLPRHFGP